MEAEKVASTPGQRGKSVFDTLALNQKNTSWLWGENGVFRKQIHGENKKEVGTAAQAAAAC